MNSIVSDGGMALAAMVLVATCVGLVVIALLRPIVRRNCGAVAVLRLWWILPLAIATIAIPKVTVVTIRVQPAIHEQPVNMPAAISVPSQQDTPFNWTPALLAAWIAGAALMAARLLRAQWRFSRRITWITRRRGILPPHSGPAVVGAFAPRLAVPADFDTRYSLAERRLMLLHEIVHLRRRDGLANLAMSTLLVLQWFNPLLHWAALALARDQESACDAVVVARYPHALRTYADALLKTHPEVSYLPLVCRWHAYHPTVERIGMLKSHRDARKHMKLAVGLLAGGAALASALVYALEPATPVTVVTPIETQLAAAPARAFDSLAMLAEPRRLNVTTNAAATAASESATAPASAPAAPRNTWDLPSPISFNFEDVSLGAAMSTVATMARVKFAGIEQLNSIKLNAGKRNVLLGPFVRVMMDCAGFTIEDDGANFTIVRKEGVPRQDDISACVDAGMPDGPDSIAHFSKLPDPAAQRYDVELKVFKEASQVTMARTTIIAGQIMNLALDDRTTLECMPIRLAGTLALGCKALPSMLATLDTTPRDVRFWADGSSEKPLPRFLRRIEFGKPDVEKLSIDGKEVAVHFEVKKL